MTYPEKQANKITKSEVIKVVGIIAILAGAFIAATAFSNYAQGAEVTVIRGDTPYRADAVEVLRGSSDYRVAPVETDGVDRVGSPARQIFDEYDAWRARVVDRKLNPRP